MNPDQSIPTQPNGSSGPATPKQGEQPDTLWQTLQEQLQRTNQVFALIDALAKPLTRSQYLDLLERIVSRAQFRGDLIGAALNRLPPSRVARDLPTLPAYESLMADLREQQQRLEAAAQDLEPPAYNLLAGASVRLEEAIEFIERVKNDKVLE